MKPFNRIRQHAISLISCLILASALSGCATPYVDKTLGETPQSQMKKPANPKPVELIFDFQTKGTSNVRAAAELRKQVGEIVQQSQLFSEVGNSKAGSTALLNITLNNVGLADEAAAKGFVTGLTLGIAGSTVTDGYVCTLEYLPADSPAKITKSVGHAMHTVVGAIGSTPPNTEPSPSFKDAIEKIVRQAVSKVLYELSVDPSFN